jgi:molecular chaperone DnaK
VQIGDRVWAVANAGTPVDTPLCLIAGLVNKCESFLEWNLRIFKVGLAIPAVCSGGPLINGLGEVVGVLTIREQPAGSAEGESCFALNVDALDPLLAAAGLVKWPA